MAKPSKVSFMDLSVELRNGIYHLALVHDRSITVGPAFPCTKVNLLLANVQINKEATPIFYGANTFEGTTTDVRRFLEKLRPSTLLHVQRLEFGQMDGWSMSLQQGVKDMISTDRIFVQEYDEVQKAWGWISQTKVEENLESYRLKMEVRIRTTSLKQ